MQLTPLEIASPLWQRLTDHYGVLLAKLRARIENPALSESDRMPLLHQIAHIKALLEMAEQPKKVMPEGE